MKQDTGGISGFRGFAVEPSGLAPPGFNPGRKDFSVADVLAWARTKPADEGYSFRKPDHCAVAQFGLASGRQCLVGVGDLYSVAPQLRPAMGAICLSSTFGQLVRCLERVVEPSVIKRFWAKLTGKTIGPETFSVAITGTWTKADAYMVAEQVEA